MASIEQQSQQSKETVEIEPDLSILIDGQKEECTQKACQSKQAGASVRKLQMPDGKTQVQLSTEVKCLLKTFSAISTETIDSKNTYLEVNADELFSCFILKPQ